MSGSFDPYHKWLGISPKDQPPNHYRLLAIDLFESDPDVISSAADQRMAHVRAFQTGKHSSLSQEILNEIAAARVCLLSPEKRADYDRQLRARLAVEDEKPEPTDSAIQAPPGPQVIPPLPPAVPPPGGPVVPHVEGIVPRPWLRRRRLAWQALTGILVAVVLLGAILTALLTGGDSEQTAGTGPKPHVKVESGHPGPPSHAPEPSESAGTQSTPDAEPERPKDDGSDEPEPTTLPEQPAESEPAESPAAEPAETAGPPIEIAQVIGQGGTPAHIQPPGSPPQKAPVPDDAAQAGAESRLGETLADASAAELLDAACADERAPDERFVLLKKARDAAVASQEVATALAATDEIIERYEIDALDMKAETFFKLNDAATRPSVYRATAENGLAVLDQAVAERNNELVKRIIPIVLAAARKSGDGKLIDRVTLRISALLEPP